MPEWEDFWRKRFQKEEIVTTDAVSNTETPLFKVTKFAGVDCIEVDEDTYHKCKFGKKPYSRWSGVIEDEQLRTFVQKHYQKNVKLMVQNTKTGSITYIKR